MSNDSCDPGHLHSMIKAFLHESHAKFIQRNENTMVSHFRDLDKRKYLILIFIFLVKPYVVTPHAELKNIILNYHQYSLLSRTPQTRLTLGYPHIKGHLIT